MTDQERVDIPVGQELFVSNKKFNDPGRKHRAEILGKKAEHFLLVDHPQEEGKFLTVDKGDTCLFRFIESERVYSFEATVLHKLTEPFPVLFFDYPYRVERFEVREKEHASTLIPVMFSALGEETAPGKKADGVLTKLGLRGCQIVTGRKLTEGATISLTFRLPTDYMVKQLQCTVKQVSTARSSNQFIVDGEFSDPLDPSVGKIDQFLELNQRIQQAVGVPQPDPEVSVGSEQA